MSATVKKIFKITLLTIGALIVLIVLIIGGATLYLTPQRLTDIINREASQLLKADIHASNIRYTIWSSFPRLAIETDSITVISRTLDNLPDSVTAQLPADRDFLASIKSFTGQINIIDFISGRYVIHEAKVDGLRINLVAYNDSINNYNIIPDDATGFKKVPYITAEEVSVDNAGMMRYTSVATKTVADLSLEQLSLKRLDKAPLIGKKQNNYHLTVSGKVSARTNQLMLLDRFPFYLGGKIQLRFDPFAFILDDYDINLGNIKGKLNMAVGAGDNPSIDRFEYKLSTINLMSLLGYLPERYLPDLTGIQAELPISASARLTSPWRFSSQYLPSLQVSIDIPEGEVSYTIDKNTDNVWQGRTFTLDHSPISALFNFNGTDPDNSTFVINPFTLSSDGIICRTNATVADLTDNPAFNINTHCEADLRKALAYLDLSDSINATGNLDADAKISFRLEDLSEQALSHGLRDVYADLVLNLKNAGYRIPGRQMDTRAGSVNLHLDARAPILTQTDLSGMQLNTGLNVRNATAAIGQNHIDASSLTLTSDNIRLSDLNNLAFTAVGGNITYHDADRDITALSPLLRLSVNKRPRQYNPPAGNTAEDHIPDGLQHSARYLTANAPAALRSILSQYDFTTSLTCNAVNIKSKGEKRGTTIHNLSASVTPDRLRIHRFETDIQSTRASLAADISGLRNFLLDTIGVQPINLDLTANLDTVNINTLAHAYFTSRGGVPQQKTPVNPAASDSVAFLVPANIHARINASAKETVYTNLHLYDLQTMLSIDSGRAYVNNLNISSDFGHAALDLVYDTADIDSLAFKANLAITDVNIVNFFKNFHALLMMMPQMKNLDGNLSVYGSIGGMIFPDMVINVPGMYADLNLQGRQLKVHQSNFIRRITKMMLIDNDDDLHIKDMDVYAHIHGNLLQLDPFIFEFDKYRLRMLGINNFNGNLYYQVGVMRNPLYLPFGITIDGMFHHPHLRFSGTSYDTERALEISQSIMEQNNVNIVGMMKGFLNEFLRKAARAATDPNISL